MTSVKAIKVQLRDGVVVAKNAGMTPEHSVFTDVEDIPVILDSLRRGEEVVIAPWFERDIKGAFDVG